MSEQRTIIRSYQFRSSSNPSVVYTTLLYSTGECSCSCPAWRFKKEGKPRSCKHVFAAGLTPVSVSAPVEKSVKMTAQKSGKHVPAKVEMRTIRRFDFGDD